MVGKVSTKEAVIAYDPMREVWYNAENETEDTRTVPMTAEGGDYSFGFLSWEDFWDWFYNGTD